MPGQLQKTILFPKSGQLRKTPFFLYSILKSPRVKKKKRKRKEKEVMVKKCPPKFI
jgi:hypothetical protein